VESHCDSIDVFCKILVMCLGVALDSVRCRSFVVVIVYCKVQKGEVTPFHAVKAYEGK